jgi:hypothetical protein
MDRSDRLTESPREEDLCVCDELGRLIDAMVMDMDKDLGIVAHYWGDGWDACGVAVLGGTTDLYSNVIRYM